MTTIVQAGPPRGTVTVRRVASAELLKLRATRSMLAASISTAAFVVAVGTFAAVGFVAQDTPGQADPLGGALAGVSPAAYATAALGALTVTGEYATGTIRPTLAAVPRRGLLVAGKSLALAGTVLAIGLLSVFATFLAARAVVSHAGIDLALTAPGVPRALAGSALYLTGVALIAAGFGWLLRSTAGALAAWFAVFVVLPVIGILLPEPIGPAVLPYLPGEAGLAIMQLDPGGQLGPWAGLALFAGYVALILAAATAVLRRRDA
jgi:hypothetical protein